MNGDNYDNDDQTAAGLPIRPMGTLPPKSDDDDGRSKAKRKTMRGIKRKMRRSSRK